MFSTYWCGNLRLEGPILLEQVAIYHCYERGDDLRNGGVEAGPLHKQLQAGIVDGQGAEGGDEVAHGAHTVAQLRPTERHTALEPIAREECYGEGDGQGGNVARNIDKPQVEVVEPEHHVVEEGIEQPVYHQVATATHRIAEGLKRYKPPQRLQVEEVYHTCHSLGKLHFLAFSIQQSAVSFF